MQTKTRQEVEILKEIRALPEIVQEKILKIIQFFRSEIIISESLEETATDDFLSVCGTWEDKRSVDEQINDIYSSRRSTNRMERLF